MTEVSYLQLHVNGQQTFLVNEETLSIYSGKLSKIINREKQTNSSYVEIDDFPGGPNGFELITRFCYNNGSIEITVSNVALLYCCAIFFEISNGFSPSHNLLQQTETFLEGLFYWSLSDLLKCLQSCEPFLDYADSIGFVEKLICSLLAKIAQNSDRKLVATSSSVSSSSSFSSSSSSSFSSPIKGNWWFNDLTILPPNMIKILVRTLGAYGEDNNSSVLTKFLLHYLKSVPRLKNTVLATSLYKSEYSGLADTVIYGVIFLGKSAFSCRGLFSVLRTVGRLVPSVNCIARLETEIGSVLDAATLDDLLVVSGNKKGRGAYDVELVMRLVKLFADNEEVTIEKMKKVGKLIDEYLGEIAPDQNLKVATFLGVAESLPDFARDRFDGIYRAIDIYLQSHPTLTEKGRSRICRCLNYSKLSLETSKDLAKNPKIPPTIAMQALASQHPNIAPITSKESDDDYSRKQIVSYSKKKKKKQTEDHQRGEAISLERVHSRVVELEKLCSEMKGQMSKVVKGKTVTMKSTLLGSFMSRGC